MIAGSCLARGVHWSTDGALGLERSRDGSCSGNAALWQADSERTEARQRGTVMEVRRYLGVLLCLVVLAASAPVAGAAPAAQESEVAAHWAMPTSLASPALRSAVVTTVERIFPADVVERAPLEFMPLQPDAYL